MTTIPKKHRKYIKSGLLSHSRRIGAELLYQPYDLVTLLEFKLRKYRKFVSSYGCCSRKAYFRYLDSLVTKYGWRLKNFKTEIKELKKTMKLWNRKNQWSVLRYIGETEDSSDPWYTHGKCYYFPASVSKSEYHGFFNNEEFFTDRCNIFKKEWEILEDPSGMAKRVLDNPDLYHRDDWEDIRTGFSWNYDFYSGTDSLYENADFYARYLGETDDIFESRKIYHISGIVKNGYNAGCYHVDFGKDETGIPFYFDAAQEEFLILKDYTPEKEMM